MSNHKTEIREGSTVWLKVGSPALIAEKKLNDHQWLCIWFNNSILKERIFFERDLTPDDPDAEYAR